MNDEDSESPLMARLRKVGDLTLTGSKPQGLPLSKIQERVMAFMLANESMSGVIAFGDGVDKDDVPEGMRHYDPVEELRKDDNKLDEILMLVEHDINLREEALLQEAQEHQSSYNVLLFGVAAKLARDEPLSDALREFVVKHLINPPNFPPRRKGKPKRNPHVDERKYFAVRFAVQHGLKPTRNDESQHHSACDLVADAAQELRNMGYSNFATGYGYDNLKKIFLSESKLHNEQRG
jgi:hypothetical protein